MRNNHVGSKIKSWNSRIRKLDMHIVKCAWDLCVLNALVTKDKCLNQWSSESGLKWWWWSLNCNWINEKTQDVKTVMKTSQTMVCNACEVGLVIVLWWRRRCQWNQWKCENLNNEVDMKVNDKWDQTRGATWHKWRSVLRSILTIRDDSWSALKCWMSKEWMVEVSATG